MAIDLLKHVKGGTVNKPPKIVLYGTGGIGKTTWAAGAPSPVFLFTEEGQGRIDLARIEPEGQPVIQSWGQLKECIGALYNQQHNYKTVVLDVLDQAERLLWKHVAADAGQESIDTNKGDFGFGRGYKKAADEGKVFLDWLDALRNKGMCIILLAHSDTHKHLAPDLEAYDRYGLKMHHLFGDLVHEWSDAFLFYNFRAHVIKDDAGFNATRARAVGQGERVIFTEERPAFIAKNRYNLPPEITVPKDNPWQSFVDAMVASAS